MGDWQLAEARKRLDEVIRCAESSGPQRVSGPDGDAFVLSALDYARFVGIVPDEGEDERESEPMNFVEFMRTSPLAQAMAAGEIDPEEWDAACRIGR